MLLQNCCEKAADVQESLSISRSSGAAKKPPLQYILLAFSLEILQVQRSLSSEGRTGSGRIEGINSYFMYKTGQIKKTIGRIHQASIVLQNISTDQSMSDKVKTNPPFDRLHLRKFAVHNHLQRTNNLHAKPDLFFPSSSLPQIDQYSFQ